MLFMAAPEPLAGAGALVVVADILRLFLTVGNRNAYSVPVGRLADILAGDKALYPPLVLIVGLGNLEYKLCILGIKGLVAELASGIAHIHAPVHHRRVPEQTHVLLPVEQVGNA